MSFDICLGQEAIFFESAQDVYPIYTDLYKRAQDPETDRAELQEQVNRANGRKYHVKSHHYSGRFDFSHLMARVDQPRVLEWEEVNCSALEGPERLAISKACSQLIETAFLGDFFPEKCFRKLLERDCVGVFAWESLPGGDRRLVGSVLGLLSEDTRSKHRSVFIEGVMRHPDAVKLGITKELLERVGKLSTRVFGEIDSYWGAVDKGNVGALKRYQEAGAKTRAEGPRYNIMEMKLSERPLPVRRQDDYLEVLEDRVGLWTIFKENLKAAPGRCFRSLMHRL